MKQIDKYIIKKYLTTFFFTVLLISIMAVVIDFAEKIGHFLDKEVSTKEIIFDYYLPFIPWINGLLWPLFSLVAVIFFTSRMAANSEIIPILNAGVSYKRLLVPFLSAAGIISILLWIGSNFLIPNASRVKNEFSSKYIKQTTSSFSSDIHCFVSPEEKAYLRFFKAKDTSGQTFRLETFKEGKLVKYLKASRIKLKEPPSLWTLSNYEIRTFDGMRDSLLIAKGQNMDTIIDLTAEDFIRSTKLMENMTSDDLRDYIHRERSRGLGTAKAHAIELSRRTSDPFTIIILTVIGVCIASRKTRGGLGLHLAMGVMIGAAFVILSRFSVTFSTNMELAPMIGVWIPNIFFSIVAVFLYINAQK